MPDSIQSSLITEQRSLQINALYNNNRQLVIVINHAEIGSYTVGNDIFTLSYYPVRYNGTLAYAATNGTVTITAISNTSVSGTFQFTASNSNGEVVNITDGNFSIPIQVYYN